MTHNTCTRMDNPNSLKQRATKEVNKRKTFVCTVSSPTPPVLLLTLTPDNGNAAQFAWSSDHRDYNSSLTE